MEVVLDGSNKMYLPIDTRDVFQADMFHLPNNAPTRVFYANSENPVDDILLKETNVVSRPYGVVRPAIVFSRLRDRKD